MKQYLLARGMGALLPALSSHSPDTLIALMDRLRKHGLGRMAQHHTGTPDELERRLEAAGAFYEMAKRALPGLSKATQKKLVFNAFFNAFSLGDEKREEYRAQHGEYPPFLVLTSPSMACDLRCFGCYAWKYPKEHALAPEDYSRVIRQGKEEMGIYFHAVSGGEPTYWPHLEAIAAEHDDCFFMVYTHGQRIDDAMAKRFADLGNIYPAISIEGGREQTDARRGPGAYDKVLAAMDALKRHGALFGFSVTHTRVNHESVLSETFLDDMIAHGASYGWVFQYIPIGRDPQWELVPTAEQRVERRHRVHAVRRNKPFLLYDFWNDGDAVDGCIGWGKRYLHVTARGYVEPCVFVHFAKDSIHEKSLGECLRAPYMADARKRQPFTKDLRRPCPQIDHPEVLKDLVDTHGLFPTHEGAEDILGAQYGSLCRTAEAFAAALEEEDARAGCGCACAPETAEACGCR